MIMTNNTPIRLNLCTVIYILFYLILGSVIRKSHNFGTKIAKSKNIKSPIEREIKSWNNYLNIILAKLVTLGK